MEATKRSLYFGQESRIWYNVKSATVSTHGFLLLASTVEAIELKRHCGCSMFSPLYVMCVEFNVAGMFPG